MRVLAITVNFRTPELTLEAVRAVAVALDELGPDSKSAIAVVDNDSGDGSHERLLEGVAALREHARCPQAIDVVASGRNGGFGFGNNVAMRRALASDSPPDFVYLFNSDSVPSTRAVATLVEYMERHPKAGIAGSRIEGTDGSRHQSAFHFPSWVSELDAGVRLGVLSRLIEHARPNLARLDHTQTVDWVSGCSLILRRSMLEHIGLFDETFFLYFEETDLCRRARDAGYDIAYVHESVVAHVGGASTGIYDRGRAVPPYWFDSRAHYVRKHHGNAYFYGATLLLAGGWASWRIRRAIQRKPDRDPPRFLSDLLRRSFAPRG
jgi:N-acetylglucosaminyl-diphospho-decaprenol L-rhamnosyltransferase